MVDEKEDLKKEKEEELKKKEEHERYRAELISQKLNQFRILKPPTDEDSESYLITEELLRQAGEYIEQNLVKAVDISAREISQKFPKKKENRKLGSFVGLFKSYIKQVNINSKNGVFWKCETIDEPLDIRIRLSKHKKLELPIQERIGKIGFYEAEEVDKGSGDKEEKESTDEFSKETQELIDQRTVQETEA